MGGGGLGILGKGQGGLIRQAVRGADHEFLQPSELLALGGRTGQAAGTDIRLLPAPRAVLVILLDLGARVEIPRRGFLREHLRGHPKIDRSTLAQGLSGHFLEISAEVSSDPVRHELTFRGHVDPLAFDRHPGGVVEPHAVSMLADSIDQSIGNRVVTWI